jgi:hypothetical protein
VHTFNTKIYKGRSKCFKFLTKDLMPDIFLNNLDEALMLEDFKNINEANKAELMQRCIVKTCESKLKKVGCSANSKFKKYWWNRKISELREKMLKANRKVTREKKKRNNKIENLLKDFKEKRRKLKKEIAESKKRAWANFCEILERDSWDKPYRMVMARCEIKCPPNDMPIKMVRRILNNPFIIRRSPPQHRAVKWDILDDGGQNLKIKIDDIKDIIDRINAKKAAGIDGVPGDITK